MSPHASGEQVVHEGTTFEVIRLEDLSYPRVREGLEYWQSLRGTRAFPARGQIEPRAIARLLTNIIVIKVVDGGKDFEFAIVGEEVSRSYRGTLFHRRLSEIAVDMPNTAAWWGNVYRDICKNGKPWAVRYSSGLDGESNFLEAEAVCLPLGPSDDVVDHILTFGKRTYGRT